MVGAGRFFADNEVSQSQYWHICKLISTNYQQVIVDFIRPKITDVDKYSMEQQASFYAVYKLADYLKNKFDIHLIHIQEQANLVSFNVALSFQAELVWYPENHHYGDEALKCFGVTPDTFEEGEIINYRGLEALNFLRNVFPELEISSKPKAALTRHSISFGFESLQKIVYLFLLEDTEQHLNESAPIEFNVSTAQKDLGALIVLIRVIKEQFNMLGGFLVNDVLEPYKRKREDLINGALLIKNGHHTLTDSAVKFGY